MLYKFLFYCCYGCSPAAPYPDKVMTFYFLVSLFRLKKSSSLGGGGGQLKMLVPLKKTQGP